MTVNGQSIVSARGVTKVFREGKVEVHALRGVDLDVHEGDFLALVGPSGSGKTTFLNLVGALDVATSGELSVLGHDVGKLSRSERARLRLGSLGFVFQAYNLVPVLTARENVEYVLELQGVSRASRSRIAADILREVGLAGMEDRRPGELSGGQQQRVAVARAIAARPKLVLADEPTANLDSENAEALIHLMRQLRDAHRMTFVFSTHDPLVVAHATRVVRLKDGKVFEDFASVPHDERGEPSPARADRLGFTTVE